MIKINEKNCGCLYGRRYKKMDNLDLGTRMKDYEMRDRYFL